MKIKMKTFRRFTGGSVTKGPVRVSWINARSKHSTSFDKTHRRFIKKKMKIFSTYFCDFVNTNQIKTFRIDVQIDRNRFLDEKEREQLSSIQPTIVFSLLKLNLTVWAISMRKCSLIILLEFDLIATWLKSKKKTSHSLQMLTDKSTISKREKVKRYIEMRCFFSFFSRSYPHRFLFLSLNRKKKSKCQQNRTYSFSLRFFCQ